MNLPISVVGVMTLLLFTGGVLSDEPRHTSFRVRIGTLVVNDDFKRRYVFQWDESEEVFDLSTETILRSAGVKFPGLSDLELVGFRAKSGELFKYGKISIYDLVKKIELEHPNVGLEALVFQGELEEDLELKLKGKTPVCRVDLRIEGKDVTLWKNLPAGTGLKDGAKSDHDQKGKGQ